MSVLAFHISRHDSNTLLQVVRYISQVLDILASAGSIQSVDVTTIPSPDERQLAYPSVRALIIRELLYSDRFYVENLEKLQEVQHTIERAGISSDYSFNIVFRSLSIILDKQRRLLLKLEVTARKSSENQTWGHHFEEWSSTSSAYADFITGEKKATEYARKLVANWDQNAHVSGLDSDSVKDLVRLLLLPSQRLPKYSILLQVRALVFIMHFTHHYNAIHAEITQELLDKGCSTNLQRDDILVGIKAVRKTLQFVNAAINRQELAEVLEDLKTRVLDWMNYIVEEFGDLLLFDILPVFTSKTGEKMVCAKSSNSEIVSILRILIII